MRAVFNNGCETENNIQLYAGTDLLYEATANANDHAAWGGDIYTFSMCYDSWKKFVTFSWGGGQVVAFVPGERTGLYAAFGTGVGKASIYSVQFADIGIPTDDPHGQPCGTCNIAQTICDPAQPCGIWYGGGIGGGGGWFPSLPSFASPSCAVASSVTGEGFTVTGTTACYSCDSDSEDGCEGWIGCLAGWGGNIPFFVSSSTNVTITVTNEGTQGFGGTTEQSTSASINFLCGPICSDDYISGMPLLAVATGDHSTPDPSFDCSSDCDQQCKTDETNASNSITLEPGFYTFGASLSWGGLDPVGCCGCTADEFGNCTDTWTSFWNGGSAMASLGGGTEIDGCGDNIGCNPDDPCGFNVRGQPVLGWNHGCIGPYCSDWELPDNKQPRNPDTNLEAHGFTITYSDDGGTPGGDACGQCLPLGGDLPIHAGRIFRITSDGTEVTVSVELTAGDGCYAKGMIVTLCSEGQQQNGMNWLTSGWTVEATTVVDPDDPDAEPICGSFVSKNSIDEDGNSGDCSVIDSVTTKFKSETTTLGRGFYVFTFDYSVTGVQCCCVENKKKKCCRPPASFSISMTGDGIQTVGGC